MEFLIDTSANGDTVWVNSPTCCIGRFSKRFGMDIHRTVEQQMQGEPQCLHCTHGGGTHADWLEFVRLMKHHFNVTVPVDSLLF
jgi:hypothetical protein